MEFESSDIESSWLGSSAEAAKESSEKQRESYKKAQAQLQKSRKDEKKAKWDNEALFQILLRFIQNPYYEEFVPEITDLLAHSVPARYILNFTALIYPESALYILTSLWRKSDIESLLSLHRYEKTVDFNESTIHPSIRNWMSIWSQITQQFLLDQEGSVVMSQKLLHLLEWNERWLLLSSLSHSIAFFFLSRNIRLESITAKSYAEFILKEYVDTLKKSLSSADSDLKKIDWEDMDTMNLFGFSGEEK